MNNRAVSVDPSGKALTTILELVRVVDARALAGDDIATNATCAVFNAHAGTRTIRSTRPQ